MKLEGHTLEFLTRSQSFEDLVERTILENRAGCSTSVFALADARVE